MPRLRHLFYTFILLAAFPLIGYANNVSVSNISIVDCTTTDYATILEFDISWENSWRDSTNHDAVWIFLKGKPSTAISNANTLVWEHLNFTTAGTNPSNSSAGSGTALDIVIPEDKRGAFLIRRQAGSGTVSTTNVRIPFYATQITWNCDTFLGSTISVRVNAIEMVYIPQGGFHAGDGGTGSQAEFEYGSSSSLAAPVNNAEGISFSNVSEGGWYYNSGSNSDEYSSGSVFNVTSSFPNGYKPFYIMKYEISQGQYTEFLNYIPRNQQITRVAATAASSAIITNNFVMSNTSVVSQRNRITCNSSGNATNQGITFSASSSIGSGRENRAANYLSWMDVAAYADWAALRPLTELEYEKAARGPIYPTPSEYAWGTTAITAANTISGTENGSEYITDANANCAYNNVTYSGGDATTGPLRCGIFATSSSDSRTKSGSGYYGVMDMSGSVSEFYVTVGNTVGIGFQGTHGDGLLTNVSNKAFDGNATNLDWPGVDTTDATRGITGATGAGYRGGDFSSLSTLVEISDRTNAANPTTTRASTYGGRLGRTAPT